MKPQASAMQSLAQTGRYRGGMALQFDVESGLPWAEVRLRNMEDGIHVIVTLPVEKAKALRDKLSEILVSMGVES